MISYASLVVLAPRPPLTMRGIFVGQCPFRGFRVRAGDGRARGPPLGLAGWGGAGADPGAGCLQLIREIPGSLIIICAKWGGINCTPLFRQLHSGTVILVPVVNSFFVRRINCRRVFPYLICLQLIHF